METLIGNIMFRQQCFLVYPGLSEETTVGCVSKYHVLEQFMII